MNLVEVIVTFIAGGTLITLVSLLSETQYGFLSGLAVLFPIVTLTGYYFISIRTTVTELREIVLFSILGVPTVWGFGVGFYVGTSRFSVPVSIGVGLVSWFAVAAVVVGIDSYWTRFVL